MSDGTEVQAGTSVSPVQNASPTPTGNPVVDIAAELGPPGATYEEEYEKLFTYLKRSGDVVGPTAVVIFVDTVRKLYRLADDATADRSLRPYDKCVFLFHIFDAIVLAYKNISFVYSDVHGVRSVYGYSESVLKNILSRVEAIARKVAAAVHDTYSLTVLNEVLAGTEQRLSQVQSERDMAEFFRAISGGQQTDNVDASDSVTRAADARRLPHGIEKYTDPYVGVDVLLRRLYRYASHIDYVRDFHDAVYLLATANTPATLSSALETRLADKDRNVLLLEAPGDRTFASCMCASAIGYLRATLNGTGPTTAGRLSANHIDTYRINYGRIFSKYRGESERNFSQMMEWIKNAVRGGERFRVFWFPDIENLMAPRSSNDQEHIATIKNAMLQHMDDFNKDRTLRSFLLLFNSSEGELDSAFSRRLETVVRTPANPLCDPSVAAQAVNAELTRYHINLSDGTVGRVAASAATGSGGGEDTETTSSRVGGFAYVQATLRDMYVNQKLSLKYGVSAIDVLRVPEDVRHEVLSRYTASDRESDGTAIDVLYDLDGRRIDDVDSFVRLAFVDGTQFASRLDASLVVPIRYRSSVSGDPKDTSERDAARTAFIHVT